MVIRNRGIARAHFDRIIDARAFDLDEAPPETVARLLGYAEATSSELVQAALDGLIGAKMVPYAAMTTPIIEAMGATPVQMPVTEMYTGLQ